MLRPFLVLAILALAPALAAFAIEPIPRRLPPPGIAIPDDVRAELQAGLDKLLVRIKSERFNEKFLPDVLIFHKAIDFALRNGEFYAPKDFDTARKLLSVANERLDRLNPGHWRTGRVVRGFRSQVDDSIQPYGLDVSAGIDLSRPVPLIVWLHGRGDKQCDLQFLNDRMTKGSEFAPPGAIVLHPFGRQCLGYKSAGETDVLEAILEVRRYYPIDLRRIALMGFSMGGAGTWHLGAHYPHAWCFVAPGAGFAETARYQKLKPENYPPWYEQTLWGQYDVPNYSRNFLSVSLVAYSGEIDPQQQAARVMEAALAEHGHQLRHLIGPGTGHAYHPETKKEILGLLADALRQGRNDSPEKVSFQTRTLRYNQHAGIEVLGLAEHWRDARVDVQHVAGSHLVATTDNVTALRLGPAARSPGNLTGLRVTLDGQEFTAPQGAEEWPTFLRKEGKWALHAKWNPYATRAKRPGLQGPIDDAFTQPFLVVTPSGKSQHPVVQAWIEFELNHLRERWRTVFRGELPERADSEVTERDLADKGLVLWGEPETNSILGRIHAELPIMWTDREVVVGRDGTTAGAARRFDRATHLPALIYPNPLGKTSSAPRYIVVNSGPTFREADDATNSRQNPRLPDWAIIDLRQPPNASLPGRIADADFFDEAWQLKPPRAR